MRSYCPIGERYRQRQRQFGVAGPAVLNGSWSTGAIAGTGEERLSHVIWRAARLREVDGRAAPAQAVVIAPGCTYRTATIRPMISFPLIGPNARESSEAQ